MRRGRVLSPEEGPAQNQNRTQSFHRPRDANRHNKGEAGESKAREFFREQGAFRALGRRKGNFHITSLVLPWKAGLFSTPRIRNRIRNRTGNCNLSDEKVGFTAPGKGAPFSILVRTSFCTVLYTVYCITLCCAFVIGVVVVVVRVLTFSCSFG